MEDFIIIEDYVIRDYELFLEENGLENTSKNVDLYIAGIHYDIFDDLELERENFRVPKELTGYTVKEYIEEKIKQILLKEVH